MTIRTVREYRGHAAHVHDGKGRLVHITDPADTREAARAAAKTWCEGAAQVIGTRFRAHENGKLPTK